MDRATFEGLLHESEGESLDFKVAQYPFSKASEEEQSELMKDVLGIANSWRRSDGYILIGVAEENGRCTEVVGIQPSEHLADHSLQQFIVNRLNKPLRLSYEAYNYDGKEVGVIKIPQQSRPFWLKSKFGPLEKEKVYVRRGSSTDPQRPATLTEICQMSAEHERPRASIALAFASSDSDEIIGDELHFEGMNLELPDRLADFGEPQQLTLPGGVTIPNPAHYSYNRPNVDFYREIAAKLKLLARSKPVRFCLITTGAMASQIRCEMRIQADGLAVGKESDRQEMPSIHNGHFREALRGLARSALGDVHIRKGQSEIEIGRRVRRPSSWAKGVF